MERYIGLDVSATSCTFAVVGATGKRLKSAVVETNGTALVEFVKLVPGTRHLCFEEGTQSEWLYEVLSPHVDRVVVVGLRESHGPKDDKRDAFALAEQLRVGATTTPIYKVVGPYGALRDLARVYSKIVADTVRIKNRLKTLYRSRGISSAGRAIFRMQDREAWIKKLSLRCREAAKLTFEEHDVLTEVRGKAEKMLLTEAKKHSVTKILETCPGIGAIRAALLVPIVVSPERFRTKRQFWSYCGLGIVTRSSSDWVKAPDGGWARARLPMTRGLNRNHNHTLKFIFKGAASSVIMQGPGSGPLHEDYQRLLAAGTKPNLAKLTIARKIAAIVLAMWKRKESYDPTKYRSTKT